MVYNFAMKRERTPEEVAARDAELAVERERIRDISVAVYTMRLNHDHPENVDRMLKKDALEGETFPGQKLRNRAGAYDALTRCYLKALAPQC